jgi:zinc transporter ZupT
MLKDVALLSVLLLISLPTVNSHIHSQKKHGYRQQSVYYEGKRVDLHTWFLAMTSAILVGSCGVFPLLFNRWIKLDQMGRSSGTMQGVLGFAAGGLLGDVWFHLIPESLGSDRSNTDRIKQTGLWIIVGLLTFVLVEKIAKSIQNDSSTSGKQVIGYLNLIANCTDNFTHGLAISASYLVNTMVGLLTTLAIICHEVPHEIGDFAILLRAGFPHYTAAKAQLITATGGLIGVVVGLSAQHIGHSTWWLLPFTSGGFIYIACVSILPELNQYKSITSQIVGLLAGVAVMACVTIVERTSCNAVS